MQNTELRTKLCIKHNAEVIAQIKMQKSPFNDEDIYMCMDIKRPPLPRLLHAICVLQSADTVLLWGDVWLFYTKGLQSEL